MGSTPSLPPIHWIIESCQEGGITFAMFEEKINSAAVKEYFATLGLDVWDDSWPALRKSVDVYIYIYYLHVYLYYKLFNIYN